MNHEDTEFVNGGGFTEGIVAMSSCFIAIRYSD